MKTREYPEGERGAFHPDALLSPTLPSPYDHDPAICRRFDRSILEAHDE